MITLNPNEVLYACASADNAITLSIYGKIEGNKNLRLVNKRLTTDIQPIYTVPPHQTIICPIIIFTNSSSSSKTASLWHGISKTIPTADQIIFSELEILPKEIRIPFSPGGVPLKNFALEEGGNLAAILSRFGEVGVSPAQYTILERLKVLDTLLTAIKSTDGIKKITDAVTLGAGIAEIGNVKNSGTFATQSTISHGKILKPDATTDDGNKIVSSLGDNDILSAVANKKLCIYGCIMTMNSTDEVTWYFHEEGQTKKILGATFQAGQGMISGLTGFVTPPAHLFATKTANKKLQLYLNAAVPINVSLLWFEDSV